MGIHKKTEDFVAFNSTFESRIEIAKKVVDRNRALGEAILAELDQRGLYATDGTTKTILLGGQITLSLEQLAELLGIDVPPFVYVS